VPNILLRNRAPALAAQLAALPPVAPSPVSYVPPFKTVGDWLRAWAYWAGVARKRIAMDTAVADANAIAAQVDGQAISALSALWNSTQFSQLSQQMLASGFQMAQSFGRAGNSIVPGIGLLVGAAVGFVVGCILAIIPLQEISMMDHWRTFVRECDPAMRYYLLSQFRGLSDWGRDQVHQARWPSWVIGDGSLHNAWQGPDVQAIFMLRILFEEQCVPDALMGEPVHFWYAAAALCGDGPDSFTVSENLSLTSWTGNLVAQQRNQFERLAHGLGTMTFVQVRANARGAGLADFTALPMTDSFKNLLLAAQARLVATTPPSVPHS